MQQSYAKNFLQIYLWQIATMIVGFLAMFIVIPKLVAIPSIYGIYSLCISSTIFLTYADLGFVGAGYKYASESLARKNLDEEIKIVGFVSYILFICAILFSIILFFLAINPGILIKNIKTKSEMDIASHLFFILAFFSPVIIFQRFLQIVYGIRLENYICQKISLLFNLIVIASIFYFFRIGKYNIVGYFFFSQLMILLSNIIPVLIAKKKYNYNFSLLLRSFNFSKEVYFKTKNLAFTSIYTTIVFIIFYELDPFVIAKIFGPEKLAFYAAGLTVAALFRGLYGTLYNPFLARFSHFVGLGDEEGLRSFYQNVIILTTPIIIFPTLSILLLMRPFIYCWIGSDYAASVIIAQFLLAVFIVGFIAYPASLLITAKEKIRTLIVISSILAIVFWIGVFFTISIWGINAFAFFKFISFLIAGVFYISFTLRYLKLNIRGFLARIMSPAILSSLVIIIILLYLERFMPTERNRLNLFIVIGTGGTICFLGFCLYYLSSGFFRSYIKKLFDNISVLC